MGDVPWTGWWTLEVQDLGSGEEMRIGQIHHHAAATAWIPDGGANVLL